MSQNTETKSIITFGKSNLTKNELDVSKLQNKLKLIVANPRSRLCYPRFPDYDRNATLKFESISSWVANGVPVKKKIYSKTNRSFAFCKHVTFDNIYDCDSIKQRKEIANSFALSRTMKVCPRYYSLGYYTEYSKGSSFWTASHLKDILNDNNNKCLAHGIVMNVMINTKTRKAQNVINEIKELCDNHYNNQYPIHLKLKYKNIKNILLKDMEILNKFKNIRNIRNKQLLYSYPIQLRYNDEDINHHLNIQSYVRYICECLLMYDFDIRTNKKVICCMSNMYWKEIRIKNWNHCYVNLWNIQCNENRKLNNKEIGLTIGTIDIDKNYCKRYNDKINMQQNNDTMEWTHYHGFVVGIVDLRNMKSRL